MNQQHATILWNRPLSSDCYHLGLACGHGYSDATPGQFVMLRIGDSLSPLLRRPFSIAGIFDTPDGQRVELLVKVVGQGTRALSQLAPEATVDLIGPLGHGFRVPQQSERIFLAAGGIGIAPIRYLATTLVGQGMDPARCHLFLGGRSREDLLCRNEFDAMGIGVTITTDDGSDGDQCLLTDPLERAAQDKRPDIIFACGPHGMLVCVAGIAERLAIPCQVSLETMMACGLGACLGCAVPSKEADADYLHACVHGPVFSVDTINFV